MAWNRIKKYSRQIVCQDLVLSCQSEHIEEIPLLKRAQVSTLSLRNQRTRSSGERSAWMERDLDLSAMLMCWHLFSSRSVPISPAKKKAEKQRRATTEGRRESICQSSLTLRDQRLYMAIEKYLLFLMPREIRKKRVIYSLNKLCSRRDRIRLSAFYIDTALGLCQYILQSASSLPGALWNREIASSYPISLALPAGKVSFPCRSNEKVLTSMTKRLSTVRPPLRSAQSLQELSQSRMQRDHRFRNRVRSSQRRNLSLYCPSVLLSPDIQYVAQSGLITLEGYLTLELS